ncbi:uncharacterized protein LOC131842986 [Achroia grisella]|uniref:uncharacterized protein LOC131842986 n=1 Tax=Achroia grisella TaxID=688607 RepID=UPI0027D2BC09|nr:uncharacterized protein LOC131842986 [Achroia grisella]
MGPTSILTPEEEHKICDWVQKMAKAGFPVTTEQLIVSVEKYLKEIKRPCVLFKHGRPGRTWVKAFIRRNPTISKRISQNLTASRARVTGDHLSEWYKRVYKELEDSGHADILNDASRIFNCDETAFFLAPKGPKVLARKGEKNVYQQVNADDKECLTVLVTGNANGSLAPTTILFSYKRIPQEIADNFPSDWGIGKTDSGWMTCEAFFEFVADIFYPWLIKNEITLPVILFVDGHISHLSLQTSQFCEEKGIVLVALYPNATHLIQPMDVAVFKPLKEAWRRHVQNWRIDKIKNDEPHMLKKKDFAKLLHEVMGNTISKSILANGFKKCGLFPWNPLEVKVPLESVSEKQDISEQIHYLKGGLNFLSESISPEKLVAFDATLDEWSGDLADLSLFNLWKKTKDELKRLQQLNQIIDSTLAGAESLGVSVEEAQLCDLNFEGFDTSGITIDASASNNNNGVLETTMETTATALPNTFDDNMLVTIPGSPTISVVEGALKTTIDQSDIIAPTDI